MNREGLLGRRASDLVSDEIFDLILQTISTGYFVSSPPPVEVDLPWQPTDRDGQRLLVSVTANPNHRTFLATFYDVTEWKRAQSRFKGEERLQALGEMVTGMAHEINNPLAAIMGLAQLSLTQDTDPSLSQHLQNILEQAKRAADVVGDLQTFAGAHKPDKASVDLAAILNETIENHYEDFEASNIVVETGIDPNIPAVQVDPRQLKQVFNNLLTNARQAIEPAHRKGIV
jgi:signal transduction histidine kinase